ncbi:hypothetical protein Trydic_g6380 [Trypoxylus dichotomus]
MKENEVNVEILELAPCQTLLSTTVASVVAIDLENLVQKTDTFLPSLNSIQGVKNDKLNMCNHIFVSNTSCVKVCETSNEVSTAASGKEAWNGFIEASVESRKQLPQFGTKLHFS